MSEKSCCTTGCTSEAENTNADAQSSFPDDPALRLIVERWNELPDVIKAGISAMVQSVPKAE